MKFRMFSLAILALGVFLPYGISSLAADSLSIREAVRVNVHQTILRTIDKGTVGGFYHLYDPLTGNLLRLKFTKLHSDVSKKDNFYVNVVDFQDTRGREVDVDFLVVSDGDEMRVTLAAVHRLEGRPKQATLAPIRVLWVMIVPQTWAPVALYAEAILCQWRAEKLRNSSYVATCLPRVTSESGSHK